MAVLLLERVAETDDRLARRRRQLKLTTGGLAIVTPVTVAVRSSAANLPPVSRRQRIAAEPTVPEGQQVPLRPEHPVHPLPCRYG